MPWACGETKLRLVSHERVSGFPEKGADLWGSPFSCGGKSGKLLGNLWIALEMHGGRSSGEVAGQFLGMWWEVGESRSSGEV